MSGSDSMSGSETSTIEPDPGTELTANISQTVEALFSASSVQDTVALVVALAVSTIEGCDFAGIFMIEDGAVTTPVSTDPLVAEVDAVQHRTGEGPCLDALAQSAAFYAEDLGGDHRWPHFGPEAEAKGIRSLLALPLLINGTPGALNLYARYPQAFGVIDRGRGLLLAAMAGMAFSSAQTHENEERRAANLHAALATREIIGQAQGILMERERITSDEAFDILRRASQHLNVKLRDVAQNLVDTGERPDTGQSRQP
jgi:GAF domain-containing protein